MATYADLADTSALAESEVKDKYALFSLFLAHDRRTHARMTLRMKQQRLPVLSNRPGRIHGGIAPSGCAAVVCPWQALCLAATGFSQLRNYGRASTLPQARRRSREAVGGK
jgi:hypothetical protein